MRKSSVRKSSLLRLAAAVALVLGGSWMAYTQNQTQPAPLKINKVTDGLYEIEGDGGNAFRALRAGR